MTFEEEFKHMMEQRKRIRKAVIQEMIDKGYTPGDTCSGCWQYGTVNLQITDDYEILFDRSGTGYVHWDHATLDELFNIWKSAIKALYA